MNCIAAARARLEAAAGLPALLDAAAAAFEDTLAVLRHHQGHAGGAFPAFVLAAAAAGSGRDQVVSAPSLGVPGHDGLAAGDLMTGGEPATVAAEIAALSHVLAYRLDAVAGAATDPDDHTCCRRAARHAARIHALLTGTGPS